MTVTANWRHGRHDDSSRHRSSLDSSATYRTATCCCCYCCCRVVARPQVRARDPRYHSRHIVSCQVPVKRRCRRSIQVTDGIRIHIESRFRYSKKLLLTYLDSKLVCAALVQNGIIISACKIIVPSLLLRYFSFFISLGILRSTWECLEHNLGNSIKVEWQH